MIAGHLIGSSERLHDLAEVRQPLGRTLVLYRQLAWICITGLGLDANTILYPDRDAPDLPTVPSSPFETAIELDRLARQIEPALDLTGQE